MVKSVERASDDQGLKWVHKLTEVTVADAELMVISDPTPERIAMVMQTLLQLEIDSRIRRNQLPNDEPTKSVDPDQENIFWDGTDIVTRSDIITVSHVNGKYRATIRRASGRKR